MENENKSALDEENTKLVEEIVRNMNNSQTMQATNIAETSEIMEEDLFVSVEQAAEFASEAEKYISNPELMETQKKSLSLMKKFFNFLDRITNKVKRGEKLTTQEQKSAKQIAKECSTNSSLNKKTAQAMKKRVNSIDNLMKKNNQNHKAKRNSQARTQQANVIKKKKELNDLLAKSSSKDAKKMKALYAKLDKSYAKFGKSYNEIQDIVEKIDELKLKADKAREIILSESPEQEIAKQTSRKVNLAELDDVIAKSREYEEQHSEQEVVKDGPVPRNINLAELDDVIAKSREYDELHPNMDNEERPKYEDNHLLGRESERMAHDFLRSLPPEKRDALIRATERYTKNLQQNNEHNK